MTKILQIYYSVFSCFCLFAAFIVCTNILADEGTKVTVENQCFDAEYFFDLKEIGFSKDKVNFNKGWLGIFMENAEGKGILVKELTNGSPAAEAGLKVGDIITKINNESTMGKDDLNLIKFKKIIETIGAGGIPVLTVFRDGAEMIFKPKLVAKLLKNVTQPATSLIAEALTVPAKEQNSSDKEILHSAQNDDKQRIRDDDSGVFSRENEEPSSCSKHTGTSFIDFAIKNKKYKDMLGATLQRIGEEIYVREGFQSENEVNPFRLSIINYLMLHPLDTNKIGQAIHDRIFDKDTFGQITFAAEMLDINFLPAVERNDVADSLQGQLQSVIDSLDSCVSLVKGAFRNLSREEFEFLYQNAHKIWLPNEKVESQDLAKVLALSQKVDLPKLFEAESLLLSKLTQIYSGQGTGTAKKINCDATQTNILPFHIPESIQYNSNTKIEDAGNFAGDILFVQDTNVGKIVIGGTGTSYYYSDAAIIIDLGGNDYYFNNAGSSNKGVPVSVCIDFSGSDVYSSDNQFTQGTGRFGIGLLADLGGNDKYLCQEFSQGTCVFGVGVLTDNDGDDFYSGLSSNQGVGFFGTGILNDLSGNDVYFSGMLAQGVGFTKGVGALIDFNGNDFYFGSGKYPDFRDPGKSFQSMSQGIGMGIRPEATIVGASGGIGILIDQKGADQYYGDYFSQGSGYYFSLGFLYDKEGNDKYYAGRYAQGAGIHSAIGLLEDKSGDDVYECYFGVSQGCGHDTGIGFLVDNGGNDNYRCETISQGVGLEKGIGVLADFYGNDGYSANGDSQGFSYPSKTEEVIGIGILIDNQGNNDTFRNMLKENLLLYRPNGGLILNK